MPRRLFRFLLAFAVLGGTSLLPGPALAVLPLPLLTELQPLQPRVQSADGLAPPLRPWLALHQRGRHAEVCDRSETLRQKLFAEAARLFYAPERKDPDLSAIEAFLERHVRGPTPLLEMPAEGFAPAATWRALAVDSCVRAGLPAKALPFLTLAGGTGADATARVALAVVRAQQAGSWTAGVAVLAGIDAGVRGRLLRALAAEPKAAQAWLAQARTAATLPTEQALVNQVAKHLNLDLDTKRTH